ncbi:HlyC/CorC family protein [Rickettsiales endosymbiont of Paramecium tredecaurelia]|uniref:hemolysin family protein n=1 Tax=Candidatus Sarmatiella mevalonica TaxID=2770581 RepID=UPI0019218CA2|nr:transporter associated domain-containing protein [Candidatus Sarmatiella mevalonica]MBL3284733.1 HlyC/CorC family protein [Candidatus Sarmatiella mevalonica]
MNKSTSDPEKLKSKLTKTPNPKQAKKSFSVAPIVNLVNYIRKLFGLAQPQASADLQRAITGLEAKAHDLDHEEVMILDNFLQFHSKTVEDAMIPRSDIVAVHADLNIGDLISTINQFHHTRILVYADNLDEILGFIHIKDVFAHLTNPLSKDKAFDIRKCIRQPVAASTSMKLLDLLRDMQYKCTHIAIVVDEYGGTEGIVTMENIIEQLLGSINDEHDMHVNHHAGIKIINSNTFIINARVEIEEIEEVLSLKLKSDEDDFDTLGGLALARAAQVPAVGSKILLSEHGLELEITKATDRAIQEIKLTKLFSIVEQVTMNAEI